MSRSADEINDSIDSRKDIFREIAIYNSVPSVTSGSLNDSVISIRKTNDLFIELDNNPVLRAKFISQVIEVVSSSGDGKDLGDVSIFPFPEIPFPPIPWPPIWVGSKSLIDSDELTYAPLKLVRDLKPEVESEDALQKDSVLAAVAAGVIVGKALGVIYNKLTTDSTQNVIDEKIAFATQYIKGTGLKNVEIASMTRPDYVNAIGVCLPILEEELEDVATRARFDDVVSEIEGASAEDILPAIAFAFGLLIGFTSEVL